jgi:fructose 1,6-bisphosphatase
MWLAFNAIVAAAKNSKHLIPAPCECLRRRSSPHLVNGWFRSTEKRPIAPGANSSGGRGQIDILPGLVGLVLLEAFLADGLEIGLAGDHAGLNLATDMSRFTSIETVSTLKLLLVRI